MLDLGKIVSAPTKNPDLTTFTVKVNGEKIQDKFQLLSFAVQKEVNRIPGAKLVFLDGDPAAQNFAASSEKFFDQGNELEILAGYHSEEFTLFKGVVVKHDIRVRQKCSSLHVSCKDPAFELTIARKNRFFENVTDSAAIESILQAYSAIKRKIEETKIQHLELVQYNTTDWDFIMSRIDMNAMICLAEEGTIAIGKPNLSQEAIFVVTHGKDIYELDVDMDGRLQYEGTVAKSWDYSSQEVMIAKGKEPTIKGTGKHDGIKLSSALKQPVFELVHSGNVKKNELQAWADSKLLRSRLAQVRGRVKIQGRADVKPGQMIGLAGVGDKFNRSVFVSGILHQLANGKWTTNIQFGMDEKWYCERYDIAPPIASGLSPAIRGLQIGQVTDLADDPEGEHRIKVRLPIISTESEGIWCRLSCLDAGQDRGTFFRPEIGDEVIVGFINEDPRNAIVLGMLHSSANPPPEPITNDNHRKGFVSREELKMIFDDEAKTIRLETPGGNMLIMDEDTGGITLQDQNGNKIVMDSNGISLESAKDINIKTNVGNATLEAVNITASAQASLQTEGSGSAEISSGGTTTVKGGLVLIN